MACSNPVALFTTCLVDQITPEIGVATVKLLRRAGCQVDYPSGQSCCGQPFYNSGFRQQATVLARQTIEILEPYETVVLPSGSCTSMIRLEYDHLLEDSPDWHNRAKALAAKTYELSDYLVNQLNWHPNPTSDQAPSASKSPKPSISEITYHDSCHMNRFLGIKQEPRQLLRESGCSLREMEESDRCCGFGGVFSIRMPELSTAMTAEKLRLVNESGAQSVVTADPGCLMQMRQLAGDRRDSIQHLAVVLEGLTR